MGSSDSYHFVYIYMEMHLPSFALNISFFLCFSVLVSAQVQFVLTFYVVHKCIGWMDVLPSSRGL
jgi:hypothetical protein